MIDAWNKSVRDALDGEAPDDRTSAAIDNLSFDWIQDREYPKAGTLEELKEQFDED